MFYVVSSIEENRLYIHIGNIIDTFDFRKLQDIIIKEIDKLKPTFDCIVDLSEMTYSKMLTDENIGILSDIQANMAELGCDIVVSYGINEEAINTNVFRYFYQIPRLEDLTDAISFLDNRKIGVN